MLKIYRKDIDGLRAIAVIAVILFHLGYLPNGYLGVDVFFVISGYLITGIVYREVRENRFSVWKFYERRIRRIIPLVLFTTSIAFILGLLFMLPDDLENLSQSVIASNLSVNNILMYITSADYWAVKNEYKPLMHTWSLGIEEQFYLFYPFLFFFLKKNKIKYIIPVLIFLTLLSLTFFFLNVSTSAKFYFIQYRFFEMSFGGVTAIYLTSFIKKDKCDKCKYLLFFLLLFLAVLLFFPISQDNDLKIILVTLTTAGILMFGELFFIDNKLYRNILSNKILVGIGKISFSLYMWHHIVYAFARYIYFEEITYKESIFLTFIVFVLSVTSYRFIENPFRNRKVWKTKRVIIILSIAFLMITGSAFYVYLVGGVIKNVPELGLEYKVIPEKLNAFSSTSNIQIGYNEDVRLYDKPFSKTNQTKILVIGDSFGRDFTNVLFEAKLSNAIEIRYLDIQRLHRGTTISSRMKEANYIFIATKAPFMKKNLMNIERNKNLKFDKNKLFIVGIKDFGYSNGIPYNKSRTAAIDCANYGITLRKEIKETNAKLQEEWGSKYIDLIDLVSLPNGKVLVFTPECKFISQDTKHFTKYGASFFAVLLKDKLSEILDLKYNFDLKDGQ